MKAIALGNRLARDIDEKSVVDLTADVRLEILDAINGGLQTMHGLAPFQSKTTISSVPLQAPVNVEIGVTDGSAEITGYDFTYDQLYRTIRIAGDPIDNQIVGTNWLLHPYNGTTQAASAIIYSDAVAVPEPIDELIGDPHILETGRVLTHYVPHLSEGFRKQIGEPRFYWMESNSINQNSPAPSVICFDTLPDKAYRLEARFTLSPARITFSDLLSAESAIPLRIEYIEVYLLPIARGLLTSSRLWRDPSTKAQAREDAQMAARKYEMIVPRTLATPNNRVGTKAGF